MFITTVPNNVTNSEPHYVFETLSLDYTPELLVSLYFKYRSLSLGNIINKVNTKTELTMASLNAVL